MEYSIDHVVTKMGAYLQQGEGIYFIGSGISVPSGLPDWSKLMSDIASPLGLNITAMDDFPRIAQYCVNADNGNRGPLLGRLKRSLSKSEEKFNPYHQAICRTNVRTLWTTNFDILLESSLRPASIAIRANDSDLTSGLRDFDLELFKVHGCLDRSRPDELILTQEDYENFAVKKPALAERLRHDLIHNSLLFIGYRYNDPNIQTVVVEARRLSGGATREHFLIQLREKEEALIQRQQFWIDDLRRFGIRTALFDCYNELETILVRLASASRGKSVFVTGSHENSNNNLANSLGKLIANERDIILLDGQSQGIGRSVADAFGKECVEQHIDIRKRIRFFPNPYSFNSSFSNDPAYLGTLKQFRVPLLKAAHAVVVFDGGMGTQAEIEVAREMGCKIIPVPSCDFGFASELLKTESVSKNLSTEYTEKAKTPASLTPKDILNVLLETFS